VHHVRRLFLEEVMTDQELIKALIEALEMSTRSLQVSRLPGVEYRVQENEKLLASLRNRVSDPAPPKPAKQKMDIPVFGDMSSHPKEILTTKEAAALLGCSTQYLEIARVRGDGPPFAKIGSRLIRYKRSTLLDWATKREFKSTSDKGK
jgi:predicted DNA-binding transcriptional regulator AlpA